ncbi:hypothetical protein LLE49_25705 [Alicyclobacillus tolerans]|uniref:IclR family transcriptional regulator domain-containing protein n=1 Tax=Alicyclobacillus tolerans TaxID=90970 RepID=UPI00355749A9|nr:hypothetical protein [Alicyclobacillus tolerans]
MLETQTPVRLYIQLGRRTPLYTGASTRLHLAFQSQEERNSYYQRIKLIQLTRYSPTNIGQLEQFGELARDTWFAISFGELEQFSAELTALVFNADGELVASVSVAVLYKILFEQ